MKQVLVVVLMLGMACVAQAGKDDLDLWFDGAPVPAGGTVSMSGPTAMIGVASLVAEPYSDVNGLYIRTLIYPPGGWDGYGVMSNDGIVLYPEAGAVSVFVYDPPQDNICWFHNPDGPVQVGLQFEVPLLPDTAGLAFVDIGYYNPDWSWHTVDSMNVEIIPEPATIGLLSMGGLSLLRRRR